MKTQRLFVGLLLVLTALDWHTALADDIIVLANKKEIRCKITDFSGGVFTYEDSDGNVKKIGPSALSKIRFDVPDAAPQGGNQGGANASTVEQLNTFPEKFVGQVPSFAHCQVDQELERIEEGAYFALRLTSKGGQYITPNLGVGRITFIVTKAMAEKMVGKLEGGYEWSDCTVKCSIVKMKLEGEEVIVALVSKIEVYNRVGKVGTVFEEKQAAPGNVKKEAAP